MLKKLWKGKSKNTNVSKKSKKKAFDIDKLNCINMGIVDQTDRLELLCMYILDKNKEQIQKNENKLIIQLLDQCTDYTRTLLANKLAEMQLAIPLVSSGSQMYNYNILAEKLKNQNQDNLKEQENDKKFMGVSFINLDENNNINTSKLIQDIIKNKNEEQDEIQYENDNIQQRDIISIQIIQENDLVIYNTKLDINDLQQFQIQFLLQKSSMIFFVCSDYGQHAKQIEQFINENNGVQVCLITNIDDDNKQSEQQDNTKKFDLKQIQEVNQHINEVQQEKQNIKYEAIEYYFKSKELQTLENLQILEKLHEFFSQLVVDKEKEKNIKQSLSSLNLTENKEKDKQIDEKKDNQEDEEKTYQLKKINEHLENRFTNFIDFLKGLTLSQLGLVILYLQIKFEQNQSQNEDELQQEQLMELLNFKYNQLYTLLEQHSKFKNKSNKINKCKEQIEYLESKIGFQNFDHTLNKILDYIKQQFNNQNTDCKTLLLDLLKLNQQVNLVDSKDFSLQKDFLNNIVSTIQEDIDDGQVLVTSLIGDDIKDMYKIEFGNDQQQKEGVYLQTVKLDPKKSPHKQLIILNVKQNQDEDQKDEAQIEERKQQNKKIAKFLHNVSDVLVVNTQNLDNNQKNLDLIDFIKTCDQELDSLSEQGQIQKPKIVLTYQESEDNETVKKLIKDFKDAKIDIKVEKLEQKNKNGEDQENISGLMKLRQNILKENTDKCQTLDMFENKCKIYQKQIKSGNRDFDVKLTIDFYIKNFLRRKSNECLQIYNENIQEIIYNNTIDVCKQEKQKEKKKLNFEELLEKILCKIKQDIDDSTEVVSKNFQEMSDSFLKKDEKFQQLQSLYKDEFVKLCNQKIQKENLTKRVCEVINSQEGNVKKEQEKVKDEIFNKLLETQLQQVQASQEERKRMILDKIKKIFDRVETKQQMIKEQVEYDFKSTYFYKENISYYYRSDDMRHFRSISLEKQYKDIVEYHEVKTDNYDVFYTMAKPVLDTYQKKIYDSLTTEENQQQLENYIKQFVDTLMNLINIDNYDAKLKIIMVLFYYFFNIMIVEYEKGEKKYEVKIIKQLEEYCQKYLQQFLDLNTAKKIYAPVIFKFKDKFQEQIKDSIASQINIPQQLKLGHKEEYMFTTLAYLYFTDQRIFLMANIQQFMILIKKAYQNILLQQLESKDYNIQEYKNKEMEKHNSFIQKCIQAYNIQQFVEIFNKECANDEMKISQDLKLEEFLEDQQIFEEFKREFQNLQDLEIYNDISGDLNKNHVQNIIEDQFQKNFGCKQQCVTCASFCSSQLDDDDHTHSCKIHFTGFLQGVKYTDSNLVAEDDCISYAKTQKKFKFDDGEELKYDEIHKHSSNKYKNWRNEKGQIDSNISDICRYFGKKWREDLEDYYDYEFGDNFKCNTQTDQEFYSTIIKYINCQEIKNSLQKLFEDKKKFDQAIEAN